MITKKGQAAMEFLMTYGWAILVVMVVIGALGYIGTLSPGKHIASRCILSPGIACVDFKVTESSVVLALRNGLGEDITISSISIGSCSGTDSNPIKDGELVEFTIEGCANTLNGRFSEQVAITYVGTSGFNHENIGNIDAQVEL